MHAASFVSVQERHKGREGPERVWVAFEQQLGMPLHSEQTFAFDTLNNPVRSSCRRR